MVDIKEIYEKNNKNEKKKKIEEEKILTFNYDKKVKNGYGIHILRHKKNGDYLISITEKGKLNLFKLE